MSHYSDGGHLDTSWTSVRGISRSLARASRIMERPHPSPPPSPVPQTQPEDPFASFNRKNTVPGYGGRGQLLEMYQKECNVAYLDECVKNDLIHVPNLSNVNVEELLAVPGQFNDCDDSLPEEPSFVGYEMTTKSRDFWVPENSATTTHSDEAAPGKDSFNDEGPQEDSSANEDFAAHYVDTAAIDAYNYSVDESMFIKGDLPSPTGGNTPSPCSSPLPDHPSIDEPSEPYDHPNFGSLAKEYVESYLSDMKQNFKNEPDTYSKFESAISEWKSCCIDLSTMLKKVAHLLEPHPEMFGRFQKLLPPELTFNSPNLGPPKKVARLTLSTKPRRCRNALILNLLKKKEEKENPSNGKTAGISTCQVDDLKQWMSQVGKEPVNEACEVSSSKDCLQDEACRDVEVQEDSNFYDPAFEASFGNKVLTPSEQSTPKAGLQLISSVEHQTNDIGSCEYSDLSIYSTPKFCEELVTMDVIEGTKDIPNPDKTDEVDDSQLESPLQGISKESSPYHYRVCLDVSVVPDLEEPQDEFQRKPEDMFLDEESFFISEEESYYCDDLHRSKDTFHEEDHSSQLSHQHFGISDKPALIMEKVLSEEKVESTVKAKLCVCPEVTSENGDSHVDITAIEPFESDCPLITEASSNGNSVKHNMPSISVLTKLCYKSHDADSCDVATLSQEFVATAEGIEDRIISKTTETDSMATEKTVKLTADQMFADDVGTAKNMEDFIATADTVESSVEAEITSVNSEKSPDFDATTVAPVVDGMTASAITLMEHRATNEILTDSFAATWTPSGSAAAAKILDSGMAANLVPLDVIDSAEASENCNVTIEIPEDSKTDDKIPEGCVCENSIALHTPSNEIDGSIAETSVEDILPTKTLVDLIESAKTPFSGMAAGLDPVGEIDSANALENGGVASEIPDNSKSDDEVPESRVCGHSITPHALSNEISGIDTSAVSKDPSIVEDRIVALEVQNGSIAVHEASSDAAQIPVESVATQMAEVDGSVALEALEDCHSDPTTAVKGDAALDDSSVTADIESPHTATSVEEARGELAAQNFVGDMVTSVMETSLSLLNVKRIPETSYSPVEYPNNDPVTDVVSAMAKIDLSIAGEDCPIQETGETVQESGSTLEDPSHVHSLLWPVCNRRVNFKLLTPDQFQVSAVDPNALHPPLSVFENPVEPSDVD